jgi:Kef-type K+ transport system membrane component KefB
MNLFHFQNPISDPVIAFTILLFIFLFFPLISKRLRIPGIIGLLIAGIIIGPHGFNLISKESGISMFGTVGLLYLMFIAALEINMRDFKRFRSHSIAFGAFTFFFPLILGFIVTHYIFKLPLYSALLYSSIFSTHTLVSYPIVVKYGIARHRTTSITVGGTIITDTGVLLLLTIITSLAANNAQWYFWIELLLRFVVFLLVVLYVFPIISKWFLKNLHGDNGLQYISVLFMVFLAALLAQALDIEPLIGAFFAGLALNKLIPHTSPLMNRIMFIGHNLFVPFFIISIGMLIDLSLFFTNIQSLIFAASILVVAVFTKFLAAWVLRKLFHYSAEEQNLIFGLSTSHAAATIAVVVVGYEIGLFDESIMNSTIILIFVSCMVSSFTTEKAAQRLSAHLTDKRKTLSPIKEDRILVPVSNPNNLKYLIDFSIILKKSSKEIPIYPLTVISDPKKAQSMMDSFHKKVETYMVDAASTEHVLHPVVKRDISVVSGILSAASQNHITRIIIGWNGKITTSNYFLGTLLENLVRKANQMIVVIKLNKPLEDFDKISVYITNDAEYEPGFFESIDSIMTLSDHIRVNPVFHGSDETLKQVKMITDSKHGDTYGTFEVSNKWKEMQKGPTEITDDELTFTILARPMSIKFSSDIDKVTKIFSKYYSKFSFGIIYPAVDEATTQIN